MNDNITGTLHINYEIDPNSISKNVDKHSVIRLRINNNEIIENSIQNTPPIILELIYVDLHTNFHKLNNIVNVLKETHKLITTGGKVQ